MGVRTLRPRRRRPYQQDRDGRRRHEHIRDAGQGDPPPRRRDLGEGARREDISREYLGGSWSGRIWPGNCLKSGPSVLLTEN